MICLKPSSWLASQKVDKNVQLHGRSPYGERGLKSPLGMSPPSSDGSLSLRRAWIEITRRSKTHCRCSSLSLRRAWIEIAPCSSFPPHCAGRSPYGERGLKCDKHWNVPISEVSLSLRRAWIEILNPVMQRSTAPMSLSLRRAWIEITFRTATDLRFRVALLTESVD